MRIAITGATGFVGRHVLEALRRRDADIVATRREPSTGRDERVQWVDMDLANPGRAPFERLGRPDVLLHLAWDGLPNYLDSAHVEHELPNQLHFLRACLDGGLDRVTVTGTCLEYGMACGELDESDPAVPTTAYGLAKDRLRCALQAMLPIGSGLNWLRLFYLYGEGQAPSSLYSQLRASVVAGAASFDLSPGDQVRDFLPIEAAADRIVEIAMNSRDGGLVNVCSGRPTTVYDMVSSWLGRWGAEIEIRRGVRDYPSYEPFAFWGSTTKLDSLRLAE